MSERVDTFRDNFYLLTTEEQLLKHLYFTSDVDEIFLKLVDAEKNITSWKQFYEEVP